MGNNLLVTVGGILSASAVIFGVGMCFVGSTLEHDAPAHTPEVAHVTAVEKQVEPEVVHGKDPEAITPLDKSDLEVLAERYNAHMAENDFEEALILAQRGINDAKTGDPEWLLRLADAMFESAAPYDRRRYEDARKRYSDLLVNLHGTGDTEWPQYQAKDGLAILVCRQKEWPQYRIALCFKNMGKYEEAIKIMKAFLDNYPNSKLAGEMRLEFARGLLALGQEALAQIQLNELLKPNQKISGNVLGGAKILQAQMYSNQIHKEAAENPYEKRVRAEMVELELSQTIELPKHNTQKETHLNESKRVPNQKPEHSEKSAEELLGKGQWLRINRAIEDGKYDDADRLMRPWLTTLSKEDVGRVKIEYAKLMNALKTKQEKEPTESSEEAKGAH